jgi:cytochrome c-type biogenesis protein CcmH
MNNSIISRAALIHMIFLAAILVGIQSNSLAQQEKSIDDQTKEISYLLMCPVCQGQSVGESNSNLANDMRDIIRKQLEQGKSKEEILNYFVNSYGESILATPPPKGINWLLWLLPAAGIIIGGIGITLFLFKAQKDERKENNIADNPQADGDNEYLKKIEEELKKNDS